jgi:hypothetical protein
MRNGSFFNIPLMKRKLDAGIESPWKSPYRQYTKKWIKRQGKGESGR